MTAATSTQCGLDTRTPLGAVAAPSSTEGQRRCDARGTYAPVDIFDQQSAKVGTGTSDRPPTAGESSPTAPTDLTMPARHPVQWAAFDELRIYAECLADAMDHRIALANRLRSGTVPADITAEVRADLDHTEKMLRRGMVKAFRRAAPEVADWTRETVGLGEETMARLLGAIGHPVIARPHHWEGTGSDRVLVPDEPYLRSVSQLWSYCGHGDPNRKRRKGMDADEAMALGSPHAKKLVYLLAVACIKQAGSAQPSSQATPEAAPAEHGADGASPLRRRSPYRDVYDDRRLATLGRSDWTDGHKHADALRIVGKRILRDLWVVARQALEAA